MPTDMKDNMTQPLWTEQLSAWSTLATAVLTLGLLIAALLAARVAVNTLKSSQAASKAALEANEQAKRDSIEQTRPYVYAEVIPSLAGVGQYDLRITNAGKSAARELTLTFSNWPSKLDDVANGIKILFETPRTLPPGCSIRSYWRLTGNFSDKTSAAGMENSGVIAVRYTSDDPSQPNYTDRFDVHIEQSGIWPVPADGPNPKGLSDESETFYGLGQVIARHIGEISR